MDRQKETPLAATGGASRDHLGGCSLNFPSLAGWRAQFPILAAHCGPEWLAMMAAVLGQGGAR